MLQPSSNEASGELLHTGQAAAAEVAEPSLDSENRRAFYTDVLVGQLAASRGEHAAAAEALTRAARRNPSAELIRSGIREALRADDRARAYELGQLWESTGEVPDGAELLLLRLAVNADAEDDARARMQRLIGQNVAGDAEVDPFRDVARTLSDMDAGQELALQLMRESATAASPEQRGSAWYAMALLAVGYENYPIAREAAENALNAPGGTEASEQRLLLLASVLLRGWDADEAVREIAPRIREAADPISVRRDFAKLLQQAEALELASDQLEQLLAQQPDDPDALLSLGTLAFEQKNFARARELLTRVTEHAEGDRAEAAYQLGRVAEAEGDDSDARKWYRRAMEHGDGLRAAVRRADLDARSGDIAAARDTLQKVREENPGMAGPLLRAEGEMLFRVGAFDAGVELMESAVASYPEDDSLRYTYALLLEQNDRFNEAEQQLRYLIVKSDGENAGALNALGYMYAVNDLNLNEAQVLIERALELQPDDPAIIDSLGWVLYKQGKHAAALEQLERAYATFPDPEVAAHLGEVLWVMNRRERAQQIWNEALAEHPDHDVLRETVERLTR